MSPAEQFLIAPFAPLIQLWAGICLLFFYEEALINRRPLLKLVNRLKALYNSFPDQYVALIKPEDRINIDTFANDSWNDLLPTIRNLAALSFGYSVIVLAWTGVEGFTSKEQLCKGALQICNVGVVLYALIATFCIKKKVFHTYWTPFLFCCALVAILLAYPILLKSATVLHVSDLELLLWSLGAIFCSVILIALEILYIYIQLKVRGRSLESLNGLVKELALARMGNPMPQELRNRILSYLKTNDNLQLNDLSSNFNQVLEKLIEHEYRQLRTPLLKRWLRQH